jgi:hypothetical protein
MNKLLKRVAATLGMAGALAVGGGSAAQLAVADVSSKAHAATWVEGPVKYQWDWYRDPLNGRYYCGVWAKVDYSWGEEVFQGKRDGWYRQWYALC